MIKLFLFVNNNDLNEKLLKEVLQSNLKFWCRKNCALFGKMLLNGNGGRLERTKNC